MHRALPIAVVLLAGTAQAALSLLYSSPSTLTLTIAVPIELAPGPEGSTTVNANKTGAKSHIEANSCDAGDDCNTTYINNTSSSSLRVRFTLLTHSNSGDCNPCRIWIERGATQETQIEVKAGAVTKSQGNWVTVTASGTTDSTWHLWGRAKEKGAVNSVATITYQLEVVPTGSESPKAVYYNMTMEFKV